MAFYSEKELREIGMDAAQIRAIMTVQKVQTEMGSNVEEVKEGETLSIPAGTNVVQMHHNVEVHTDTQAPLVPTTIAQLASYKNGSIVELPSFADGQPFVVRMIRPSMLALVKSGKIPNSLLNQATSLFANGASALNAQGKGATNMNELFEVIDVIVEAALLEPTIEDIHSVDMELTDDQLMAIFSYTQRGVKGLEQFRTKRADS